MIADLLSFLRSLLAATANSLRSNASLAALSLVLALALWIFVTDTETARKRGVVDFDIPVEAVNVPADVAVGGPIPPIRVRIEVDEDEFKDLIPDDFRATVDLLGLQVGTQEAPVTVEALTRRGGLRIIEAIPDKVEVALRSLTSRAVPVIVEIVGSPLSGYELGDPELESETVIVSGTEELVALVRDAVAYVEVTGLSRDLERAFRLQATDGRGRGVEGVVVEPAVVNIRVAIRPSEFSRSLLVSPVLEGSPGEGYNLAGVTVEPLIVTVVGSLPELSALRVVRTRTIDIDGATSDVEATVPLMLPADINIVGSRDVKVTVRITPALGQATFQVTLGVRNLGPDLSIANSLPPLVVTLSGELPTLKSLGPLDIVATLNLEGLQAGNHVLLPEVEPPPEVALVSITPDEIEVILELKV